MSTDKEDDVAMDTHNSAWESEIMIKDSRWSMTKGKKKPTDLFTSKYNTKGYDTITDVI